MQCTPIPEILTAEIDSHLGNLSLRHPFFRECIADGKILQTQICKILQISVILSVEHSPVCSIASRTREIGILVGLAPDISHEVASYE
jgi:hypothetical protein